ncbi:hypothetical protein OJ997_16155 [Solirubrobacter phytolaccae]|uniref:Right handed beta helix domain-containing protein n=1 Tax=Solirubrobacter phytolaccae TaxID=1404360 RepID=A0A9X3NBR0_9ACTN|nr:hypothetical protein [Solirubrobacter phytolaccae]MDA0181837.1 hypothetical protein [Solirubrobacter phytolaccae]
MLAAVASLATASPAAASTYTVTGFTDSLTGSCQPAGLEAFACTTLRAAVTQSNTSAGADAITLGAGRYDLTAGDLLISDGLTVSGVGPRQTTVSANQSDRVFTIGADADATIGLMTIRDGSIGSGPGGNILVNQAATLGLTFARVTNGTATQGAGISNQGELTVAFSTIDGNVATTIGGGIDNNGIDDGAQVIVGDSTIAGNTAPEGGGISSRGGLNTFDLLHATIARNTGSGIWFQEQQDTLAVGSILAGNSTGSCTGTGTLSGNLNVDSGSTCGLAPTGNQLNTDPQLALTLSNQGGQFSTDVLTIPATSPAANSVTPCFSQLDQRNFSRGGAPCDAGAYDHDGIDPGGGPGPDPDPTPTPTPDPPPPPPAIPAAQPTPTPAPTVTPTPTPVANRQIVVEEQRGTVKVQLPGTKTFVDLDATRGVPVGSTIDTRKGAVVLTAVPKPGAPPEKATFYDGLFKVTQSGGLTTLTLTEELDCPRPGRASLAQRKPKKRKLWGDGKGAFRTQGKYSAATVRGTKWVLEDTCTSTTIRVTQGTVYGLDRRGKRVIVRPGKPLVVRAKP